MLPELRHVAVLLARVTITITTLAQYHLRQLIKKVIGL